jgi:SAM-dependent methyltransferase
MSTKSRQKSQTNISRKAGEQVLSHISKDDLKSIEGLFERVDNNKEFEFIFFSKKRDEMNKEKYVLLLKFMRAMRSRENFQIEGPHQTLDIVYTAETGLSYRIEIDGSDVINLQIQRLSNIQNRNYVIFKFLLQMMKRGTKNIRFGLKSREEDDNIDVDDLNVRARLSSEIDLTDALKKGKLPSEYSHPIIDALISGGRLSLEEGAQTNSSIRFRLKERTSLYFDGTKDSDHFSRIDLTNTKTVDDIRKLQTKFSNYELEIEYGAKDSKSVDLSHLSRIFEMSETVLKLVQQSAFIVGNDQTEKVINFYRDMMGISEKLSGLVARQAVSLEVQHATELLPNRYAVTDKADGDRYFLIILKDGVFLISSNLNVRDTGIVLDDALAKKYEGTIMDGEFLYLSSERRHTFMVFDCLRSGQNNLRGELKLMDRLRAADKIIEECFVFEGQSGFQFKETPSTSGGFDIEKIAEFYGRELARFYSVLNEDIQKVKTYPLIRRKFFMGVTGAKNWEIFRYSVEYWNKYTKDPEVKFPYLLDGLIYHPLEQAYVTNANQSKYAEYKWKPPSKNSIDFYIEFVKDPVSHRVLDVYDNSRSKEIFDEDNPGMVRNKPYRICKLFVGQNVRGKEYPVPFTKNGVSDCYVYLTDGEPRDESGDVISDKTVVEFYYQDDASVIPQQRWIPIKTRYDKTESVERYGKKYGNYTTTADRIWRSIINPILMSDMMELAKGNTPQRNFYDQKIAQMNKTIDHALIVEVNKENKYYQKQTKLAATMRQYHNFIKSNLIYTYCNKMYNSNNQLSVLDIACGRGGDINKFYYTAVASYVGIDIDAEGIKSPVDGAVSRYNRQKKKKPNFPDMYFIQADARAVLEYDTQIKALSGMDDRNKKLLERFFPTTGKKMLFDRVNCQFAIHYFLENQQSWDNFKQNLNNHLRAGGYFFATTFDAHQVIKSIGNNESFAVHLDDEEGNKRLFFEIVKKYRDVKPDEVIGVGQPIDLHAAWMFNEGVYFTEYLVDVNFLREELDRDCDMELVDTDLFQNQMAIHRQFLTDSVDYESTESTRKYLSKTGTYYEDTEINLKCREYTNMNRYYVFRKRDGASKPEPGKSKMKGGRSSSKRKVAKRASKSASKSRSKFGSRSLESKSSGSFDHTQFDFADEGKYRIPDMQNYNSQNSLLNSIHKIMVSHSMIPKSVRVREFIEHQDAEFRNDVEADNEYINDLASRMTIDHDVEGTVKRVMDGLNVYLVERDCNNFYDVSYINGCANRKKGRAIVLMKEGMLYKPLMRREDKGIRGMFKLSDPLISYLEENGSEV